ncbi:hypothetical protein BDD12DRAFT_810546 [Trichophaea hybrida]|nr:hypothetical protein BDD12DRAFT_810546 [Trichophaea hybrida]
MQSTKSMILRIKDVPAGTASEDIKAVISTEIPSPEEITTIKVTLCPSCSNDNSQTGLLEFLPRTPAFLDEVMNDHLGAHEYQLEVPNGGDINIDRNFYGLTALYDRGRGRLKRMWLRDFVGPEFPNCRTMIYGYDSKLENNGFEDITDYKRGFLEELRKTRSRLESMVKAKEANPVADPVIHALTEATRAILFFGAPHRGIIFDDVLASLTRIRRERNWCKRLNDILIFSRLNSRDPPDGRFKRTGPYITKLDKNSSLLGIPQEKKYSVSEDHSNMVKFGSKSSPTIMPATHPRPSVNDQRKLSALLLQVAKNGDFSEVSSLLLLGADVSEIDENRQTALHLVASQGHREVVRLLLNADAEIDPRMNLGYTPLYLAARSGALDVVQLLVERKADVNANKGSWTPLITAARNGRNDVVSYLVHKVLILVWLRVME